MRIVFLSLFTAMAFSPAMAADTFTELDEIIFTATGSGMAPDRLPAVAVVIDREAIERFAGAGLPELLRNIAGFDIAANGGPGAATSVFIRGTESNHVLVLVDGIEMNPGSIGSPALQHVPLESIERIEIIKGPRSALYGSEAIGGVVNIITRRSDDTRLSVAATAGSYDTRTLEAAIAGANEGWRYGLDAGRHETDGFAPRIDSDIERGYERDQLNAYAGWRGDTVFVEARHWRAEGVSEYLGFALEPIAQEFRNATTALDVRYAGLGAWSTRLLIGNGRDEMRQRQANFLGEIDFVETDRDTLDWQHDLHVSDTQLLTAGIYAEDTQVIARSYGDSFDESADVTALYVQDVVTFDKDSIVAAVRSSDYEAFDRELTWNLGWNRKLNESNRVFMAAGSAFRAPDATDRFGFGGNPDLQPETSQSIELGYEHAFSQQHEIRVNAFRNDIDDLVAFVDPDGFAGPESGGNVNIDEARIEGIELEHEWRGELWRWHASAIVQDPRDLAQDSQLARRARRSLAASYVHEFGTVEVGINALATDSRPDSPYSTITLPGYGILGASLRWFFAPGWSLATRVENLTDREYQTAAGYNTAERSYYMTVRYSR